MVILYSRREELVTLQYGTFTILGEQANECAKKTVCSNRVTKQILQGQLYLSELRRKHPGLNTMNVRNGVSFCWSICSITQPS